jgi:hypothetical protein
MEPEYKELKKDVEKSFKKIWGPRCKVKDTKEFPDLKRKPDERCMTCRAYDRLDEFLADLQNSL